MKRLNALYLLSLLLFIVALSSCIKDTTGYAFPDNSNQIVTFASISPDSGVVVYLTRSLSPNGVTEISETDIKISGAEVILFKNSVAIDTLIEEEIGFYKNPNDLDINAGDKCTLQIISDEQTVYSNEVIIPDTVKYSSAEFSSSLNFDSLYYIYVIDFDVLIEDVDPEKNNFSISSYGQYETGSYQKNYGIFFNYDYAYMEACFESRITPSNEAEIAFTDKCFNGENFNLKTIIGVSENNSTVIFSKVYVYLRSYSPEYYAYLNQFYYSNFSDGYSQYTSPLITYSNMSNGFGIFYGFNSLVFTKIL